MSDIQPNNNPDSDERQVTDLSVNLSTEERAAAKAANKQKCSETLEKTYERVMQIKYRLLESNVSPLREVITVINLDDPQGAFLAKILTPEQDLQEGRELGEESLTHGLASKVRVQGFLDIIDEEASAKLRATAEPAIIVVDHGVAEIFPANWL